MGMYLYELLEMKKYRNEYERKAIDEVIYLLRSVRKNDKFYSEYITINDLFNIKLQLDGVRYGAIPCLYKEEIESKIECVMTVCKVLRELEGE